MMLKDHINTMPGTSLIRPNDDRFGRRFLSLAMAMIVLSNTISTLSSP